MQEGNIIEIGRLTRLEMGYVGEKESRTHQIDVSAWLEKWPNAAIAAYVQRPDETSYMAAVSVENGIMTWEVTEGEVAVAGRGMANIRAIEPEKGKIYKTRTVETIIRASMNEEAKPDAPNPMDSWVTHAALVADEAQKARTGAEEAKTAAETAKTGAEEAKTAAETAKTGAEEAKTAAETAKTGAEEAKTAAETAKTGAEEAANNVGNTLEPINQSIKKLNENKALKAETSDVTKRCVFSSYHANVTRYYPLVKLKKPVDNNNYDSITIHGIIGHHTNYSSGKTRRNLIDIMLGRRAYNDATVRTAVGYTLNDFFDNVDLVGYSDESGETTIYIKVVTSGVVNLLIAQQNTDRYIFNKSTYTTSEPEGTLVWILSKDKSIVRLSDFDSTHELSIVNVVSRYGIDNTGSTYVSDAINSALSTAENFAVLYFPSGTYKLDKAIKAGARPCVILGDSYPVTQAGGAEYARGTKFVADTSVFVGSKNANETVAAESDMEYIFHLGGASRKYVANVSIMAYDCTEGTFASKDNAAYYLTVERSDDTELGKEATNGVFSTVFSETTNRANLGGMLLSGVSVIDNVNFSFLSGPGLNISSYSVATNICAEHCGVGMRISHTDDYIHNFRAVRCGLGMMSDTSASVIDGVQLDEIATYGLYLRKNGRDNEFVNLRFDYINFAGVYINGYMGDKKGNRISGRINRCGCYMAGWDYETINAKIKETGEVLSDKCAALYAESSVYDNVIDVDVGSIYPFDGDWSKPGRNETVPSICIAIKGLAKDRYNSLRLYGEVGATDENGYIPNSTMRRTIFVQNGYFCGDVDICGKVYKFRNAYTGSKAQTFFEHGQYWRYERQIVCDNELPYVETIDPENIEPVMKGIIGKDQSGKYYLSVGPEAGDWARLQLILKITGQPVDVAAEIGENVTFAVTARGTNLTYLWQYSKDEGVTWSSAGGTGNNTATMTLAAETFRNGYLYRCMVTDSEGKSIASNSARLTVTEVEVEVPQITSHPASVTAQVGTNATFSVTATGTGLSYLWQYSKDEGVTWSSAGGTGNNTATMTLAAETFRNGYLYRCMVTNSAGKSIASNSARLTVIEEMTPDIVTNGTDAHGTYLCKTTRALTGTGDIIDTGCKPYDTEKDWTILCRFSDAMTPSDGNLGSIFEMRQYFSDAKRQTAAYLRKKSGDAVNYAMGGGFGAFNFPYDNAPGYTAPTDGWHNAAIVKDGDKYSFYLDGGLAYGYTLTYAVEPEHMSDETLYLFGRVEDGTTKNTITGTIADFRVYQGVMTEEAINSVWREMEAE